jgi:hypothetical protein
LREIYKEHHNPNTKFFEKIDYLLYIGADTSSEPLFEYLNKKEKQSKRKIESKFFSQSGVSYVCELGKKPSNAPLYLDGIQSIAKLLDMIRQKQGQRAKNRSYSNLLSLDMNN